MLTGPSGSPLRILGHRARGDERLRRYWYGLVEGWTGEPLAGGPLYYSVVAFVTAPPHPMPAAEGNVDPFLFAVDRGSLTRAVVLFGCVLGTREPM